MTSDGPGSSAAHAMRLAEHVEQELEVLRGEVRALRNRLVHAALPAPTSESLERIAEELGEIDTYLENFVERLHQLGDRASASAILQVVRSLDSSFRATQMRWTELVSRVGEEAAKEALPSDVETGWQSRWGRLFETAYKMRQELDEERRGLPASRLQRTPVRLGLMLDLRYGAGLSFAHISGLVNLSQAGVQVRVADFEDNVAAAVVKEELASQLLEMPDPGWRLSTRPSGEGFLLRPPSESPQSPVSIFVLFARDDREGSAGRPRLFVGRFGPSRTAVRRIWAVVSVDGPVLFLPGSLVQAGSAPAHVIALARERGYERLAQAVEAGETESKGGAIENQEI